MCTLPRLLVCVYMYIARLSPMHFHLLGQFLFAYCKLIATRAGSDFIQPCVGILYVYGSMCVFVCVYVCVGILYV